MSWAAYITVEHGDGYSSSFEVVSGHTYNLTPMWRKATGVARTSDFDGRSCRDLAPLLTLGYVDAISKPAEYKALNPANGWGDYEGFLEILALFARKCWEHPKGVIEWIG